MFSPSNESKKTLQEKFATLYGNTSSGSSEDYADTELLEGGELQDDDVDCQCE